MKHSFEYWKKLHEGEQLEQFSNNSEGLLWLKTKSIIRKDILVEFLSGNYKGRPQTFSALTDVLFVVKSNPIRELNQ